MIPRISLALILCLIFSNLRSQEIQFPDLYSYLDMRYQQFDTLIKKKGYRLMQKDVDSASALYYYSSLERNEETPTWVRSVTIMDAKVKAVSARMLMYRTYSAEEYRQLLEWLLLQNFRTSNSEEIGDAQHHIYSNGRQSVRIRIQNNTMKSGRIVKSYEIEIGK